MRTKNSNTDIFFFFVSSADERMSVRADVYHSCWWVATHRATLQTARMIMIPARDPNVDSFGWARPLPSVKYSVAVPQIMSYFFVLFSCFYAALQVVACVSAFCFVVVRYSPVGSSNSSLCGGREKKNAQRIWWIVSASVCVCVALCFRAPYNSGKINHNALKSDLKESIEAR